MATKKTFSRLEEERLSQEELVTINEFLTNKNKYIQVNPSLDNCFNQLEKEILAYRDLLHDEISARIAYQGALKPKMDPYIVGGLTSGLAGGAAGLYAANETANKNQNIDEKRAECRQKVNSVSREVSQKAHEVRQFLNALKEKISALSQSQRKEIDLQCEIEKLERILDNPPSKETWNMLSIGLIIIGVVFAFFGVLIYCLYASEGMEIPTGTILVEIIAGCLFIFAGIKTGPSKAAEEKRLEMLANTRAELQKKKKELELMRK